MKFDKSEMKIPPFKEARKKDWEISKISPPPIYRGYFNGLQPIMDKYWWRLMKKDEIWMSTTPAELESQIPHLRSAEGSVMVAGGGMGIYLYNVLQKPEVKKVTLIEKHKSVLSLLVGTIGLLSFPYAKEKLVIKNQSVFAAESNGYDFAYIDIWPTLGAKTILKEVQRIQTKIQVKKLGFWGQELEFIFWAIDRKIPREDLVKDTMYFRFKADVGLPLIGTEFEGYPQKCIDAATNMYLT